MARKRNSRERSSPTITTKYNFDETFDNSEDEFFAERDKILLEDGPVAKRQRKIEDDFLQPSDEEVLRDDSESEDDDRNWETSKDYYNADIIETEADALEEEREALRLQQKQFQNMTAADFGVDEQWTTQNKVNRKTVTEILPDVIVSEDMPAKDRLKILNDRYPEFQALAKDFSELREQYQELRLASKHNDTAAIKNRAVLAYLGAIAMYFALFTSAQDAKEGQISAMPAKVLREHPIMETLYECRRLWAKVKDMQMDEPAVSRIEASESVMRIPTPVSNTDVGSPPVRVEMRNPEPQSAKERKHRRKEHELVQLLSQASKGGSDSDFGDENPLTAQQAAEKARRKKSLRFYAAQLAHKSNKRSAASREAGGDDDIPHKERLRDRQARLLREAEKRGHEEPDNMEVSEDEYYDMIATKAKEKKEKKAPVGQRLKYAEERVASDGKRAINYAIAKNKGLTPKRKKEVRNPRVRKRKKFDEKQKKLGSIRQVYKGGEGKGGYGGELTGIKANVVKSIKL